MWRSSQVVLSTSTSVWFRESFDSCNMNDQATSSTRFFAWPRTSPPVSPRPPKPSQLSSSARTNQLDHRSEHHSRNTGRVLMQEVSPVTSAPWRLLCVLPFAWPHRKLSPSPELAPGHLGRRPFDPARESGRPHRGASRRSRSRYP